MSRQVENWLGFWDENNLWWSLNLWKTNVELFLRNAEDILQFKDTDTVLDIGCGSGYLESLLAGRVESIVAADTSEHSIDLCREACRMHENVSFKILGQDYTNFSSFERSFSLILCLSVVQYYEDIEEIESLIRSVEKLALPGSRMLIADLPLQRNAAGFLWDAFCSFMMSVKEGYTRELFNAAHVRYFQRSEYSSFNRAENLLCFTFKDIDTLITRMGLNARVINRNLSVYANRPSILINF